MVSKVQTGSVAGTKFVGAFSVLIAHQVERCTKVWCSKLMTTKKYMSYSNGNKYSN